MKRGIPSTWQLQATTSAVFGFVNQEQVRVGSASPVPANAQRIEGGVTSCDWFDSLECHLVL